MFNSEWNSHGDFVAYPRWYKGWYDPYNLYCCCRSRLSRVVSFEFCEKKKGCAIEKMKYILLTSRESEKRTCWQPGLNSYKQSWDEVTPWLYLEQDKIKPLGNHKKWLNILLLWLTRVTPVPLPSDNSSLICPIWKLYFQGSFLEFICPVWKWLRCQNGE